MAHVEEEASARNGLRCLDLAMTSCRNLGTTRHGENEIHRNNHIFDITMAAFPSQVTALPRFLLPQLSCSPRTLRPAALGVLEVKRHRSSRVARCAPKPVAATLLSQCTQAWQRPSSHPTTSYTSALHSRRHFSATAPHLKDHHFDTLKFVQRLKDEGFTEEQAEGMMRVLGDVIEERYA